MDKTDNQNVSKVSANNKSIKIFSKSDETDKENNWGG